MWFSLPLSMKYMLLSCMNYTQGLPLPDFSLHCKARVEVITIKIPSDMDIRFNGYFYSHFTLFSFMFCRYFNKTGLSSFAKTPNTDPKKLTFFLFKFYT